MMITESFEKKNGWKEKDAIAPKQKNNKIFIVLKKKPKEKNSERKRHLAKDDA